MKVLVLKEETKLSVICHLRRESKVLHYWKEVNLGYLDSFTNIFLLIHPLLIEI